MPWWSTRNSGTVCLRILEGVSPRRCATRPSTCGTSRRRRTRTRWPRSRRRRPPKSTCCRRRRKRHGGRPCCRSTASTKASWAGTRWSRSKRPSHNRRRKNSRLTRPAARPSHAHVQPRPRSSRGMARSELHGARDRCHFYFGGVSLLRRYSLDLEHHPAHQPDLGAGAVHLSFHLDGEIRCGLRRAHRHSRRRRRPGAAPRAAQAPFLDHLRPARRGILHRDDRRSRRDVRVSHVRHRPGLARSRAADVGRLSGGPARLLPHVLSLPAGRMALPPLGRAAGARPRARRRAAAGGADVNGWIIFILLVALMLTGMPISIALGLTVLGFLFFMTDLPAELVSQRLFTGLDQFAIMAIPFFILAGTFLTHGGVARRMIRFATALVGHFHGGLAMAGGFPFALFAPAA